MPTRPPREPFNALVLAALAVAVTGVLIAAGGRGGGGGGGASVQEDASWQGLAGAQRPRVAVGQRVIVVLKTPAVADRVGGAGGLATSEDERRWERTALSSQKLLIARLRLEGLVVQPEFSYTRTINGFSAAFDARGIALLERAADVAGVYPVRAAYPASLSSRLLSGSEFGSRPNIGLSDKDGRGVTIALLDTGVDRAHPFLRGRVASGIDIVGGDAGALAAARPDEPAQLERHGTELAGLLVGSGGPGALAGVAPGATVLPIRVAGWQRDASANWAVYGRTDQVLAGLDRAVDPNGDAGRQPPGPAGYQGAVPLLDFFDRRGSSLVAGRAALVPAGIDPNGSVANAAQAGAVAVLFYGADLPAGGIGLDERTPIPAVSVPVDVAHALLDRIRSGVQTTLSLGAVHTESNAGEGRVMGFSSTGLAFDGRVKPEVVAPGVALETAEPGANADGSARYGTVNGTSAAAALVAGSAALLAQARPYLDADALKSLLVGAARPLPDDPVTAQGVGMIDRGGATAIQVRAGPAVPAIGAAGS